MLIVSKHIDSENLLMHWIARKHLEKMYAELGHYECCSLCCCGVVYDNSSVWSCWQFLLSHFYLLQSHLLQEANFWLWTVMNVHLEWETAFWAAVNVSFHSAAIQVLYDTSAILKVHTIYDHNTPVYILSQLYFMLRHTTRHPKCTWYYSATHCVRPHVITVLSQASAHSWASAYPQFWQFCDFSRFSV